MCWSDVDRYTQEWEDDPEIHSYVPLDDYISSREVEDYGPCNYELGNDDNEEY